jgi:hypothetical protein
MADDLLLRIKNHLVEKTEIANIAIIDDVDAIPCEAGFPAVGIFDGGDEVERGASEGLRKHFVFLVIYAEVSGSAEDTVLAVRAICDEVKAILPAAENFETDGIFNRFAGCSYLKTSKVVKMTKKDSDDSFVAMKMPLYQFLELVEMA